MLTHTWLTRCASASRVLFPDAQIEYVTAVGGGRRCNVEVASEHYGGGDIPAKAAAGFQMYAASGRALVRGCGQAYALQTVAPVTYRCGTRRVCQARSSGSERVGGELLLSPQSVEIIKFGDPGSGR